MEKWKMSRKNDGEHFLNNFVVVENLEIFRRTSLLQSNRVTYNADGDGGTAAVSQIHTMT